MLRRAKLCRFYGFSHSEVMGMPVKTAGEYLDAVAVIESQERLLDCQVSAYPHLKADRAKKIFKAFQKQAVVRSSESSVTTKELIRSLDGRNNNA